MSKNQKNADVRVTRKSPRLNEAQSSKEMYHGNTGLVYDPCMANHKCLWYPSHQECPERFTKSLERCKELGLVERCEVLDVRKAEDSELLTVHSQALVDELKHTDGCLDPEYLEKLSSKYDAVYIHPETYKLSLLSAGCTIQLVKEICKGTIQNGLALVRPPGHHAMKSEFCGYCFFNNVAVAARYALDQLHLQRILIVDWDVHHGQATQQMFYNDPRVVYFSIHRYEHGEFWPNLRESEFDHVGEGQGAGYNFNVPLNKIGMGDSDYMAIFHQLLLPMASEFQPELIIVSAGYDAAVGCPEGEMVVTPACYAHLVSALMGLASGKVAVVLEGGYCVRSLSEGVALTLKALLGDPCPSLPPLSAPCESIQESILNCIYTHRAFWQCFQLQGSYLSRDRDQKNGSQHWPQVIYNYSAPVCETYPTRDCCPVQTQETKDNINKTIDRLVADTKLLKPKHRVCFVYDSLMMEHRNLNDPGHPEKPGRIERIYERHLEFNLLDRLFSLESRFASREELLLVHEEAYLNELEKLCASVESMTDDVKYQQSVLEKKNSVYIHPQSYKSACIAAGSLLQVVDSVLGGDSKSGVAVIRPPGHHAESYQACGFCMFNNVSIAAKYAMKNFGIKRILILDWDVHHGNGTQRIFLSDPRVLYMSIHRYDRGTFFPSSEDAAATVVGSGPGVGFNVNIPWNQKGMGNTEYVTAFHQIVLPIAYQFAPELVLVSAGFDAAVGDPLGGCKVSPETYALLTSLINPLAMGRIILCLEGGYNLTSISYAMTMCTKALLGDPVPPVDLLPLKASAASDIKGVINVQVKYWSALCFNKEMPKEDVLSGLAVKQNNATRNTEVILNRLTSDDNVSKSKEDDNIAALEEQFKSQLHIINETTSFEESTINLSQQNSFATQVTNEERGEQKSSQSKQQDSEKPGPSQGSSTSASGTTSTLRITMLDSILQQVGMDEGFAVYPRHDCPHLPAVRPVPASGIDINSPCSQCLPDPCATLENWICLTCYSVCCGRVVKEHMMHHSIQHSHPIVLGFEDLSVWCYTCDSYIESPVLYDAKNSAYVNKFGQVMPNIYHS